MKHVRLFAAILCAASLAALAADEDETAPAPTVRSVRAAYTTGRITVDGALAEKEWLRASPSERVPALRRPNGRRSRLATECFFLYDAENLYVAARCEEPNMEIVPFKAATEAEALAEDHVAFCFDIEGDGRSYLLFAIGPSGTPADMAVSAAAGQGIRKDLGYTSGWKAAALRGEKGWTVEAAIPLAALRLGAPPAAEIGFEVTRKSTHAEEVSRWAAGPGLLAPPEFGRLAIGDAPVAVAFHGVDQPADRDPAAVFELRNPGWRRRSVEVSVRLKSASRSTLTSQEVELDPLERALARLPLLFIDPRIALEIEAVQSEPRQVLHRQQLAFDAAGLKAWLPQAVCREGRSRLPLALSWPGPTGPQPLNVWIVPGAGGEKLAAASAAAADPRSGIDLDVRALVPGAYRLLCWTGGPEPPPSAAESSLVVVPQAVRPGAEPSWLPESLRKPPRPEPRQ